MDSVHLVSYFYVLLDGSEAGVVVVSLGSLAQHLTRQFFAAIKNLSSIILMTSAAIESPKSIVRCSNIFELGTLFSREKLAPSLFEVNVSLINLLPVVS